MPKVISDHTKTSIVNFARQNTQTETAKRFNVSRMLVNSLINNRPLKRTRERQNKYRCPITGF